MVYECPKGQDLTLQFIFFDGEEAFRAWTSTDSLYGSRHLARKWQRERFQHQGVSGSQLDRIDVFMLLDLLGAKNPRVTASRRSTGPWFERLMEAERAVSGRNQIFRKAGED